VKSPTRTPPSAIAVAQPTIIGTRRIRRCVPRTAPLRERSAPQEHVDSSWLNLIERWFRDITDKRIRRGVFRSVKELIAAIESYIAAHNRDPKTFTWTAKAETILAKVRRARAVLDKLQAA